LWEHVLLLLVVPQQPSCQTHEGAAVIGVLEEKWLEIISSAGTERSSICQMRCRYWLNKCWIDFSLNALLFLPVTASLLSEEQDCLLEY